MFQKLQLLLTEGTKGSQSAKSLAQALSLKYGYKVFRTTKVFPKKKQLKYGQGVDKLMQYRWFEINNIPALEYTQHDDTAALWVKEGHTVVGRKLLSSSCGKGIVLFNKPEDVGGCPVYTKYKKKKREFRVHVFQNTVVRVVEKKLRKEWNGPKESKVRNLANGYVFCGCDSYPEGLPALAVAASGVVQSDFKGVDVGYNEHKQELFVIEVNSAPGIEGSNIAAYAAAI